MKLYQIAVLIGFATISYLVSPAMAFGDDIRQTVIAEIGDEQVTYQELEKAFKKNMNRQEMELHQLDMDSLKSFLDLYINYRLKVVDAVGRGFDKDSAVVADIEKNRKILAESYFYEKKLMNPWIESMLKLRRREIQFGIILIKFPAGEVSHEDSLRAKVKAEACMKLINDGFSFEDVARDSSEDNNSKKNGGIIQKHITGGQVARNVEEIMFDMKPGEVYPEPLLDRWGYIILKVVSNEPRKLVLGSHILLSKDVIEDSLALHKTADSIMTALNNGASFEDLARKYSGDLQSAQNGGRLGGYYSRSTGSGGNTRQRLMNEFEEAMFALKDGEYSKPVETIYGIHIIRRDSTKDIDEQEERESLKLTYKRLYYEKDKKAFLDSLYQEYKFEVNDEALNEMLSVVDTTKTNLDAGWADKISEELREKELYTIFDDPVNVGEFVDDFSVNSTMKGYAVNERGIRRGIDKLITPLVFNEATKYLEKEYPDFKDLMAEFRDGILFFKAQNLEVWDKLKFDTTLAHEYWEPKKEEFKTKPSYEFREIFVLNDSVAKKLYEELKNGADFAELAKEKTQRAKYREKGGYYGVQSIDKNDLAKLLHEQGVKEGELYGPEKNDGGYIILKLEKFYPVRTKTFEEAIPDFAPEYQNITQDRLTNEWIKRIKDKYEVEIDFKAIDKVRNKLNK